MKKLLVIDDQVDICFLLEIYFKKNGFIVESANNGSEGFSKLKSFSPDIVISDIKMPVCNGFEFLRMVDAEPSLQVPVVFFSAYTGGEERDLATSRNFAGFFRKPVVCKELHMKIKEILKI